MYISPTFMKLQEVINMFCQINLNINNNSKKILSIITNDEIRNIDRGEGLIDILINNNYTLSEIIDCLHMNDNYNLDNIDINTSPDRVINFTNK